MRAGVIRVIAFAGLLVCGAAATAQEIAYAKNNVKAKSELPETTIVREEIADFIIRSAAARIISAEEGRLAAEKGTTNEIKAYGELMIKDQGRLLGEIKRLAVLNNITIPEYAFENDLRGESGKQFNKAYVKAMILEHERDIQLFKEAMTYGDPEVSDFAARYLPLIELHLRKIKEVER